MQCFIDLYDLLITYILIWMLDNDASYHYTHLLCTFRIPKCDLGFLNTVKENGASATSFIGLGIPKWSLIG